MIITEIIAAILFVLSSGLFFNERFRSNITLVTLAGLIALVSTYFLTEQIIDRVITARLEERFASNANTQIPPTTKSAPQLAHSQSNANTPSTEAQLGAITEREVRDTLQKYIYAWRSGDIRAMDLLLDPNFSYIDQRNIRQYRNDYLGQKTELARRYDASPHNSNITIGVSNITIETSDTHGSITYDQAYRSLYYASTGKNTFRMRKTPTGIKITEEIFQKQ